MKFYYLFLDNYINYDFLKIQKKILILFNNNIFYMLYHYLINNSQKIINIE
jgi:hypothetical protein